MAEYGGVGLGSGVGPAPCDRFGACAGLGSDVMGQPDNVTCKLGAVPEAGVSKVSMGVQLSYNIVRHTPLTTYAEVAPRLSK